ncbi:MAG: ATP-binding cassette domain-containing protein [Lachnospiraceae bacterium]|nr:ATP-binding cassette domain-containing protein [Lachnospiraceae bacterium]
MNRLPYKKTIYFLLSLALWLLLWELAAVRMDEPIFLPRPWSVLEAAGRIVRSEAFGTVLSGSLLRIAAGFVLGTAAGVLCAALSSRSELLAALLRPPLKLIKTVPVASFVILLLLWVDASELSMVISLLIVIPIVFENVSKGIGEIDPQMREAAYVFHWKPLQRLRYLVLPAAAPYFLAACRAGLGMCWKAGVAAEIIGHARNSIGIQLYNAKLTLDTEALFAWTLLLLLASAVFAYGTLTLLRFFELCLVDPTERYDKRRAVARILGMPTAAGSLVSRGESAAEAQSVPVEHSVSGKQPVPQPPVPGTAAASVSAITKSYYGRIVVPPVSAEFAVGTITILQGPSGCGKTTLLRLLLGLEKPDGGSVRRAETVGVCFQENRLCEWASAWKNVKLGGTGRSREEICRALTACGIRETERQPVREFSGGMKRRVALLRALMNPGSLCVLDEPFHGLDEERKAQLAAWVRQKARAAAVVLVTHDASEIAFFAQENLPMQLLRWNEAGEISVEAELNSDNRNEKWDKI